MMAQEDAIRLDQFLKYVGAVGTGGQAKYMIQGGEVQVNGQVETRRSHKLQPGDEVTIQGQTYRVEVGRA